MSKPELVTDLRCSFCYKSQADVQRLVAGPKGVAICNECVEVCNDIVADVSNDVVADSPRAVSPPDDQSLDESDLFPFKCPACGHQWKIAKPR